MHIVTDLTVHFSFWNCCFYMVCTVMHLLFFYILMLLFSQFSICCSGFWMLHTGSSSPVNGPIYLLNATFLLQTNIVFVAK